MSNKYSTSLGQLICAIVGFAMGWGLSFLIIFSFADAIEKITHYYKLLHFFVIVVFTYAMHKLGGKFFPHEKYGVVNVRKFVWTLLAIIILAFIILVVYKVMVK